MPPLPGLLLLSSSSTSILPNCLRSPIGSVFFRTINTFNQKEIMEVEVKLRLRDQRAHQSVSDLLAPFHLKTHIQENVFFDGSNQELSSNFAVLRLRFYDGDSNCVASLKARSSIIDGVSRVEEDEEPLDPAIARACVAEPWRLAAVENSRILKRLKDEFEWSGEKGFVCLGGFRNVRAVYDWEGLKLELDETQYDFGTNYEIECESAEPDTVKKLLEDLLTKHGISYQYSMVSKFVIFRSGILPE
ncbi:triphosphate tunnel metalloenzyme 3-like [Aristolochia californica]|uniref:triphosphate tunnel metalloenzyme 3-like n=1 Tax=Aristolochia californica TaxID=171875 RepID=UPI0035DACC61